MYVCLRLNKYNHNYIYIMELQDLSVLITGGAGFIGSHIAEYLLKNKVKFVRIIDNLATGSKDNISHLLSEFPNLEFVWADITNLESCRKACLNIDIICHQAALGSVPRSINNPLDSHNANVNGYLNILLAAKENFIKRIVYASSSAVYGTNNHMIKIENECGIPMSPYGVTKCINELYGNIFTKMYDMECIGLRYFNVFGPRQNPSGAYAAVIPKFIKTITNDTSPIINGDGSYSRDFTYVDNIVHANILALTTTNSDCFGQAYNVGTNNSVSINELVDMINYITGKQCTPTYGLVRIGDIPYSNASIEKIFKDLGYKPKVYFKEGLIRTIDFFTN